MGTSASGVLFFGLYFGEEMPQGFGGDDGDYSETLTERLTTAAGFEEVDPGWVRDQDNSPHYEWLERRDAAIKDQFGDLKVVYLGHYDYPTYGLSAKEYNAEWGEGVKVEIGWNSKWVDQLVSACIALEIDLSDLEFAWHLSSSYG